MKKLVENYNRFFKTNLSEAKYGQMGHIPDESEFEGDGEVHTDNPEAWEEAYDALAEVFNAFEALDANAPFDADLIAVQKKFEDLREMFEETMENVGVDKFR